MYMSFMQIGFLQINFVLDKENQYNEIETNFMTHKTQNDLIKRSQSVRRCAHSSLNDIISQ